MTPTHPFLLASVVFCCEKTKALVKRLGLIVLLSCSYSNNFVNSFLGLGQTSELVRLSTRVIVRERGVEPPPPIRGLAPEASASAIPPLARSKNITTGTPVAQNRMSVRRASIP